MSRSLSATTMVLLVLLGPQVARAQAADTHSGPVPEVHLATAANPDSVGQYGFKTTSNNQNNITFTNSGGWGVGYTSSKVPNWNYPSGSPYEHMVRGGLWIGAVKLTSTGADTVVSFASEDENGAFSSPLSEFTPLPNTPSTRVVERSTLTNSPFYSRQAVSEQDFVMHFRDLPGQVVNNERHAPLPVDVTENVYGWSFDFAKNFVIQHFVIRNIGDALLRDVLVTHYTEVQNLNKKLYPNYPNALTNPAPYNKKYVTYDDSLHLMMEYYCESVIDCHREKVPVVVGIKMLGTHPDTIVNLNPHAITRNYSGLLDVGTDYARDNDLHKYIFMSRPTEIQANQPGNSDPSQWLTIGPIPILQPGDSISVDFAFVAGADTNDLKVNAAHAQLAFDLNYNLPKPPPSPHLYVRPVHQGLELLWDGASEAVFDSTSPPGKERDFEGYKVYMGLSGVDSALKEIGQFDIAKRNGVKDTTGFNTGLDSLRMPPGPPLVFSHVLATGDSIRDTIVNHYFIRGLRDGFKYFLSVTSFDTGNERIASLESGRRQNLINAVPGNDTIQAPGQQVMVFPNPYRVEARWSLADQFAQDHYLWFVNLPTRCRLRIYTLGGDLVQNVDFDARTYNGSNARGLIGREFGINPPQLSGSMYAWDMISHFNQAVGSGLYLFSVEEIPSGKRQVGKFVIIKSDREEQ